MSAVIEFMGMHMKLTIGIISFLLTEVFLIWMTKTNNKKLEKTLSMLSLAGMGIFTLDVVGSVFYYILKWICWNIKNIDFIYSRDRVTNLFLIGVLVVLCICAVVTRAASSKSELQGIEREIKSMQDKVED